VEEPALIQRAEKGAPDLLPAIFGLPLGEAAPTGGRTRVGLGQITPARPGAEDPENAFETGAVIGPRPAAARVWPAFR